MKKKMESEGGKKEEEEKEEEKKGKKEKEEEEKEKEEENEKEEDNVEEEENVEENEEKQPEEEEEEGEEKEEDSPECLVVKFEMIGHPSVILGGKEIVAPMNGGNLIQRLQLLPSRFHLLLGFGQLVILGEKMMKMRPRMTVRETLLLDRLPIRPAHYGTKLGHFETSIIHFPTSEGVSEVSEQANE